MPAEQLPVFADIEAAFRHSVQIGYRFKKLFVCPVHFHCGSVLLYFSPTQAGALRQFRKHFLFFPCTNKFFAFKENDLICDLDDPLLVADYDHRLIAQPLEHLDEIFKAPQINARLRLVEQEDISALRDRRRELYTLEFPAGKRTVNGAVDIVAGTKPDGRKTLAHPVGIQLLAARELEQFLYGYALEPYGLLKGNGKAFFRAFRHGYSGYVFAVEQDLSGSRLLKPHQNFYERRLSAAVRPGDDADRSVIKTQIHIFEYILLFSRLFVFDGIRNVF